MTKYNFMLLDSYDIAISVKMVSNTYFKIYKTYKINKYKTYGSQ